MSRRPARDGAPNDGPRAARDAGSAEAFDRWLAEGLAPDDHDRAAGRMLADAWRDRRRALDRADGPVARAAPPWRRRRWWAPLAVVAIAIVAVASWPTPLVVDEAALAGAYLDAMRALPMGAP